MAKTLLEIQNLSAGYDKNTIIEGINFSVNENDYVGIIGPNGGGKTTLLKVILGLLSPVKGQIIYHFSKDNTKFRDSIGYLPQQTQMDKKFPISVKEVIASGLSTNKPELFSFMRTNSKRIDEVLEIVGMSAYRKIPVGELSGGQLQRVFLGRAIISNPRLLILDEPDTFVDNRFENELYQLLRELNEKMAILLVSHDVGTISSYIKTIACVNKNMHYHPSNIISSEQL